MIDYLGVQYEVAVNKQTISLLRAEHGHLNYHLDVVKGVCYLLDSERNKVCQSQLSIVLDALKEQAVVGTALQKDLNSLEIKYPMLRKFEGGVHDKMMRWNDISILAEKNNAIQHALEQSRYFSKFFRN